MRLAYALVAVAVVATPLSAHAETTTYAVTQELATTGGTPFGATGLTCGMVAVTDPTAEPGTVTGEVHGGPVASSMPVNAVTIECSVQVNSPFHRFGTAEDDNDAAQGGPVADVLPPTLVSFTAAGGDIVYLCTEWHEGDTRWYYDDLNAGGIGAFITTPDEAHCTIATSLPVPETGPVGHELDPLLCPVLAIVFPPEGDVVLPVAGKVWDCPPYDA